MSGIGLLLSTARDALLTQQLALDVVGHNIANINTPGYTRQEAILTAKVPASYSGLILGRGVDVEAVVRNTDHFIETRLQQRQSDLTAMEEKEAYMTVLEGIFSENSGRSLSTQLSDFWNSWYDLANNPSGLSERSIVYERGALLSQSFKDLAWDFSELKKEINLALEAGVESVNDLLSKIADLNTQIVSLEVNGEANDLHDRRLELVNTLSEYLDVRYYENEDGNLTVTTGRGYILVGQANAYPLTFDGTNIKWESSGMVSADLTDTITGGKLGGWLDVRDAILPKYERELDELAKTIIWEVNAIHTQGAGLDSHVTLTGASRISDATEELGTVDSGLDSYDRITDGTFTLWLYDNTGALSSSTPITIDADPGGTTANQLVSAINAIDAAHLSAALVDGKLTLSASGGYAFTFSDDTSHVLSALGVNTFFTGKDANSMDMNATLTANKRLIAAARVGATGETAAGDNSNALALADLQFQDIAMKQYLYVRGQDTPIEEGVVDTMNDYLYALDSSIGIRAQSLTRSREYNELIVEQLSETRNNVSAVSIDEEMTDLIRYQHAYSAAAKLVTTADEMLRTILEMK